MKGHNKRSRIKTGIAALAVVLLLLLHTGYVLAAGEDVSALRSQLEEQRTLIREQSEMLKLQQKKIEQQTKDLENLSKRLDKMEQGGGVSASPSVAQAQEATADSAKVKGQLKPMERDAVGDLNAEAVRTGEFPGSFRIPGTGDVSLAIGGFVKAVGIYDSDAENMGADFLPATLGTRSADKEGATSLDATITRLHLDARAPVTDGQIRGYVEYDLNASNNGSPDFKLRHAYGTWKNSYGTLTAGHTWSTAMDLKIIPEGLTEPTVSGVIFQRQSLVRWSQPISSEFTLHAALEDPNSSDVFSDMPTLGHTSIPDGVLGLEYDPGRLWHLRLNGLMRDIQVDLPAGGDDSKTAWGLTLTGHVDLMEKDKLRFSSIYGEGVGRYLLGIQSTAGSIIDPVNNSLELRKNWGVMAAYEHHWTDTLRSTAMVGYAHSKSLWWQRGTAFENSTYGSVNLMWNVHRYITLGIEYGYGRRENQDDSDIDNHRIAIGMQFY